jgi:hypothetical protein
MRGRGRLFFAGAVILLAAVAKVRGVLPAASADVTVTHLYLPAVLRSYCRAPAPLQCRGPANNAPAGACGPLEWGAVYREYISSPLGTFLGRWGSRGDEAWQFDWPAGIGVASDDTVYVADVNNNRVKQFSAAGAFLAQWGSFGSGDGEFDYIWGISVGDAGSVYVTDSQNWRVQYFSGGDRYDWFYFDMPVPHTIEAWLTEIPAGNDYELYLMDGNGQRLHYSAQRGNLDEHILWGPGPDGRYYLVVLPADDGGWNASVPYALRVEY